MFDTHNLTLTKSNVNVTLKVFIPDNKKNEKLPTMYFFDGQNTYFDEEATYKRSLRAHKYLNKRNILGVAITGYYNEDDRDSTYCPYKLYEEHNPDICINFIDDLKEIIIPFIQSKYNVYTDRNHQILYGSSLAAITALYAGFKYDLFKYIASFSTASFICEKELFNFIKENKKDIDVYLYVGTNEKSDSKFNELDYLLAAHKLFDLLRLNNMATTLKVKKKGIHNEKDWQKALKKFLKYYSKQNKGSVD